MPAIRRLLTATVAAAFLVSSLAIAGEGKEGKEGKEEAPALPKATGPTDHYVHNWVPMVGVSASQIPGSGGQQRIAAKPGRALVILFLASWCEPCQQLMPEFMRLAKHYRDLPIDFVYMFAHDTRDDAEGFLKEFSLEGGYLANYDVLKAYHNPELPSVYIGDRHGWLTTRYIKATSSDLAKMDELLRNLTAY